MSQRKGPRSLAHSTFHEPPSTLLSIFSHSTDRPPPPHPLSLVTGVDDTLETGEGRGEDGDELPVPFSQTPKQTTIVTPSGLRPTRYRPGSNRVLRNLVLPGSPVPEKEVVSRHLGSGVGNPGFDPDLKGLS